MQLISVGISVRGYLGEYRAKAMIHQPGGLAERREHLAAELASGTAKAEALDREVAQVAPGEWPSTASAELTGEGTVQPVLANGAGQALSSGDPRAIEARADRGLVRRVPTVTPTLAARNQLTTRVAAGLEALETPRGGSPLG